MADTPLTDITIKALKPPQSGQITHWDHGLPGFGIRISQGGAKTFILMHGKRRRRLTIGRYPIISLAQARDKVRTILAERTLGTPILSASGFENELKSFIKHHCEARNRPGTAKETERLLNRHFLPKLEGRKISEVSKADVADVLDGLSKTPSEARHAFVAIRTFLRWSVKRGALNYNPIEGMEAPHKAKDRSRVLTLKELGAVYKGAGEGHISTIIRLLILTGQRRGEIAGLRGEYINKKQSTVELPKGATKQKREHVFPLSNTALKLLGDIPASGYLFPARGKDRPFNGWSKSKPTIEIPHWTLHDLRRSFSTHLSSFGVLPHIVERLLGHTQGTLSPIAQVYNKYAYLKEMRAAVKLWEKKLAPHHRDSG